VPFLRDNQCSRLDSRAGKGELSLLAHICLAIWASSAAQPPERARASDSMSRHLPDGAWPLAANT
jgi:hypothetical protein